MTDDRIQLILDLGQSGKNAAEVRQELEKLNAASKDVAATYEVLAVSGHGYELGAERVTIEQKRQTQAMEAAAAEAKRLADEEQRLADEALDKVTRAAIEATQAQRAMNQILEECTTKTSTATVSLDKTGKAAKGTGQGVLSASYAIQDFTSQLGTRGLAGALSAVQNNIPQIVTGFGAGAGIAGAVSVAAVAVGLLYENWGKLSDAWTGTDTAGEAEKMERLAKAASDAAKAIQAQITALKDKEGKSSEAADIAKAAIDQAGGTQVAVNAVQRQLAGESGAAQKREELRKAEEVQQRLEERKRSGLGYGPGQEQELSDAIRRTRETRAALSKLEDDLKTQAQSLIVDATKGDTKAIAELARRFPGEAFGQASPDAIRAQNAEVDAVDEQGQRLRRGNARRKAAGAQVDALNQAGRENEAALGRDQQKEAADELKRITDGLDKIIASNDKSLSRDDPRGDARRAGIAQRSEFGRDFRDFANNQGYSPLKGDIADAARSIQADVNGGASREEAMQAALEKLIYTVQKGIEINNKRADAARRFVKGVDNLPVLMDEGNQ